MSCSFLFRETCHLPAGFIMDRFFFLFAPVFTLGKTFKRLWHELWGLQSNALQQFTLLNSRNMLRCSEICGILAVCPRKQRSSLAQYTNVNIQQQFKDGLNLPIERSVFKIMSDEQEEQLHTHIWKLLWQTEEQNNRLSTSCRPSLDDDATGMGELKTASFAFLAATLTISDHHNTNWPSTLFWKASWPKQVIERYFHHWT